MNPLPFRLSAPGSDTIGLSGIKTVAYKVAGVLQLHREGIRLEWIRTKSVDEFSFENIGTKVEALPAEWIELPWDRVIGAWLVGGWWRPTLELRAWGFEDFEGVPGARGVTLPLRIHRRDRASAESVAREIAARAGAAALTYEEDPRLGPAELDEPGDGRPTS